MRAAAIRSLERAKLCISKGIEQNKLDQKKRIIYNLMQKKVPMNYQQ